MAAHALRTDEKWIAPAIMLILCVSGMMTGFAIDLQSVLPETVVSLCGQPLTFGESVSLHLALLPATNMLMFASGLVAAGFSAWPESPSQKNWYRYVLILLPYLACSVIMLAAMFLSEWMAPRIVRHFGFSWTMPEMICAMIGGMICGLFFWTIMAFAAEKFASPLIPACRLTPRRAAK